MSTPTVQLDSLKGTISDLEGVAPAKVTNTREAQDAAAWLDEARKTEADAEEILGPEIRQAYEAHRSLTGARKSLFAKLDEFKNKLRGQLSGWISKGNPVEGYRIQNKYAFTAPDLSKVPDEYKITTLDEKKLQEWAKQTEGKIPVAGVTITPIPILYAKGEK